MGSSKSKFSSPECDSPIVVGCVENNPSLSFSSLAGTIPFFVYVFVLMLTYSGVKYWTNSITLFDVLKYFWHGLTFVFSKTFRAIKKGNEIYYNAKSGVRLVSKGKMSSEKGEIGSVAYENAMSPKQRIAFFVVLLAGLAVGYQMRNSTVFGAFAIGVIIIGMFLLSFLNPVSAALLVPVIGGLVYAGLFSIVFYLASLFNVSTNNAYGDTMFNFTMVYLVFCVITILGERLKNRGTESGFSYLFSYFTNKNKNVVVSSPQSGTGPARVSLDVTKIPPESRNIINSQIQLLRSLGKSSTLNDAIATLPDPSIREKLKEQIREATIVSSAPSPPPPPPPPPPTVSTPPPPPPVVSSPPPPAPVEVMGEDGPDVEVAGPTDSRKTGPVSRKTGPKKRGRPPNPNKPPPGPKRKPGRPKGALGEKNLKKLEKTLNKEFVKF